MAVTAAQPENFLLSARVVLNLYTGNHYLHKFRIQTYLQKFEGGLSKHILEKNTVFWKKGVEIWAFGGSC